MNPPSRGQQTFSHLLPLSLQWKNISWNQRIVGGRKTSETYVGFVWVSGQEENSRKQSLDTCQLLPLQLTSEIDSFILSNIFPLTFFYYRKLSNYRWNNRSYWFFFSEKVVEWTVLQSESCCWPFASSLYRQTHLVPLECYGY